MELLLLLLLLLLHDPIGYLVNTDGSQGEGARALS
jgi:hypothetical protein